MSIVIIDQSRCRPAHCENGVCVAQFTCTWRVLEQSRPFELPEVDARRCLGCARCALICPLSAIQIAAT
ncbi:MAG: 4Fe-4S binding protein [Armatimonadetes bacterium]|nr:4Fe-4S binding protein [Armatimonadota bacterium]